jgi:MFS family permease
VGLYLRILRRPQIAILLLATTLGRLPFGINGLAILLFLREQTGSFAIAGLTVGALALGSAIGAPLAGRLVDRRGTAMLLPLAFTHAAALLAIWWLGLADAPGAVLAGLALLGGAAYPPSGSVLRSRWPELLGDPELVRGAYALDSALIEISFVGGPLITAATVAFAGPEIALGIAAVLVIAGTILFLVELPPSAADDGERQGGLLGAFGGRAIRTIALTTLPVGFCLGTIEVAIPAFSEAEGNAELAGVLLALWSGASGIGGLLFGIRRLRHGLVETYVAIALLFPLVCLPVAIASEPLAMAAVVVLAGLPIAPLIASRNELVAAVAPPGTQTEAFTWLVTSLVAGLAAGNAVAGAVIERDGWPAAVLIGVGVAAIGALGALGLRDSLRPAAAS